MSIRKPRHSFSTRSTISLALGILISNSGCFTNTGSKGGSSTKSGSSTASSSNTGTTPATSTGDQFKIANVVVTSSTGSSGVPNTNVYFDPTKSVPASGSTGVPYISSHCTNPSTAGVSSKPCLCQFSWSEVSSSGGTTVSYARTVSTAVSNAQQSLLTCPAPDVFVSEITDGTAIKIAILPGSGNSDSFTIPPFTYTKNLSSAVGSFKDAEGHSFDNIMHYACYERSNRGGSITNKTEPRTDPTTGKKIDYLMATKFCVTKPGGTPPSGCASTTPAKPSIQSAYYNFFIRASEAGDANQWNDAYSCPTVKESLYGGSTNNLWPMDTNFALSLGKTADFNVGVDAFVELSNGGTDPVSAGAKGCDGKVAPNNASTTGFVQGCLGFATKPNSDGSCPYFRDANNQIRFTYRLRRYIAVNPPVFQVGGQTSTSPQSTDTVYVLDRPVTQPVGTDPLKPYSMRGPKPCNYAYFDSGKVASAALSSFVSTNHPNWNAKNLDGIKFPGGLDSTTPSSNCAASIPLPSSDGTTVSLGTAGTASLNTSMLILGIADTDPRNALYVRPAKPFSPHYEEDADFLACAPQASVLRDPPLHFARNSAGNVAWCSESYPSQSDHIPALDPSSTGNVIPFTSHVVKKATSLSCTATIPATIPTTGYPPAGKALHLADLETCDRTATNSNGWKLFPLLAPAPDVERMLVADDSYTCAITYDGGGAKSASGATPTGGCCASPSVSLTTSTPTALPLPANTAHLEPDVACLQPKY